MLKQIKMSNPRTVKKIQSIAQKIAFQHIEASLLKAMRHLDEAAEKMERLSTDQHFKNAIKVVNAKKEIKSVLNGSYDKCAQNRK